MIYKQLLSLKQYSITLKNSFESSKIEDIDFTDYGYVNYMLFYITNMIYVYNEILFFIEKHHLKIKQEDDDDDVLFIDEDENIDLKNILLTFTDEVNSNLNHLDKNLPNIFIEYVSLYHENKKLMDEKVKTLFKHLPKYKIVDKEFILMDENEINKIDIENQFYSFEISYSVNVWEDFYNKLISLINNEDYIEILKHLGFESYE